MAKKKKHLRFNYDAVKIRYLILTAVFCIFGAAILGRAFMMMHGEQQQYWLDVSKRFKREGVCIPAKRGNIVSADGQVLATTLPEYNVFMDFTVKDNTEQLTQKYQLRRDRLLFLKLDSMCNGLHRLFPQTPASEFREKILTGRYSGEKHFCITPKRITYLEYCKLRELPFFCESEVLTGVHAEAEPKRKKPFGNLATSTIGSFNPKNLDHKMQGLEEHFDVALRGIDGLARRQKVQNRYLQLVDSNAVNGCDVVTTLDVGMQDIVASSLRERMEKLQAEVGICILMEVKTGDVKAIASMSNPYGVGYNEYENRAISSYHSPGSVFKTASFMAAIEDGKLNINSTVDVGNGHYYFGRAHMSDSHQIFPSLLTVADVIEHSSNVGTSVLIDRCYHNHPEEFVNALYRTGIKADLGVPLSLYKKPNIRLPKTDSRGQWFNWSATALPWMSIGYETQLSPIQTLAFYNGIANGGVMLKPRFVTELRRGNEVEQKFPVEYVHPNRKDHMMCSPATLQQIQACLSRVVQRNRGTGMAAYTKKFRIAGKTGTAQVWSNKGNTGSRFVTFVGYFPADKPLYSMIVCIEGRGLYGGSACGPVFKRVAETIWARNVRADLRQARDTTEYRKAAPQIKGGNLRTTAQTLSTLGIEYKGTSDERSLAWGGNVAEVFACPSLVGDRTPAGRMPDVTGYGLRDAVYRLERMGLRVKAKGVGTVRQQSVAPGTAFKRGQTVVLTLVSVADKKLAPKPKPKAPAPGNDASAAPQSQPEGTTTTNQHAANLPQPAATTHTTAKTTNKSPKKSQ